MKPLARGLFDFKSLLSAGIPSRETGLSKSLLVGTRHCISGTVLLYLATVGKREVFTVQLQFI